MLNVKLAIFIGISLFLTIVSHYLGFIDALIVNDFTFIGVGIIFTYFLSLFALYFSKENLEPYWFLSEVFQAAGMLGTIIGLIYMLGNGFATLDVSNVVTAKDAIKVMALGISTALYTTLVGLLFSNLLKVYLMIIENHEQK